MKYIECVRYFAISSVCSILLMGTSGYSAPAISSTADVLGCEKYRLFGVYENFSDISANLGKHIAIRRDSSVGTGGAVTTYTVATLNETLEPGYMRYTAKGLEGYMIIAQTDDSNGSHCWLTWVHPDGLENFGGGSDSYGEAYCISGQDADGNMILADRNNGCDSKAHILVKVGEVTSPQAAPTHAPSQK